MSGAEARQTAAGNEAAVITKAVLRAQVLLQISQRDLGAIIGVSPAAVSAAARRGGVLPDDPKRRELALLFLRAFRSLDAIVGGADAVAAQWLRAENAALPGVPLDRMKTVAGLVEVVAYLDQRRAPL